MSGPNSRNSQNALADRNSTALMATFNLPAAPPAGPLPFVIQLKFFCRSFSIRIRQAAGTPRPATIAYSKEGLLGFPGLSGAQHTLFPDEEPLQRFFWRDDEGPPYIWLTNKATVGGVIVVQFEYFPTRLRHGDIPMATPANRDFPTVRQEGAIILPGV